MEEPTIQKLKKELEKRGMTLVPINNDGLAIKDEPKYKLEKL